MNTFVKDGEFLGMENKRSSKSFMYEHFKSFIKFTAGVLSVFAIGYY